MKLWHLIALITLCIILGIQQHNAEAYMRSHGASEAHINRVLRD